jgi:hypothetical protein
MGSLENQLITLSQGEHTVCNLNFCGMFYYGTFMLFSCMEDNI